MGIEINRPLVKGKPIKREPCFYTGTEVKTMMIESADGDKFPVKYIRQTVTVITMFGDAVAFVKTNRGSKFEDSRGGKLSEDEVKSELLRLLDNKYKADSAFMCLTSEE